MVLKHFNSSWTSYLEEEEWVEDLDPYFKSLSEEHKNWTISEEEYCTTQLRMPVTPQSVLSLYKGEDEIFSEGESSSEGRCTPFSLATKGKLIQGIHSYDVLQNPDYQELFRYEPVGSKLENIDQVQDLNAERSQKIFDGDADTSNNFIQSDLVRLVMNLPYMPLEERRKFKFSYLGYLEYVKKEHVVEVE